LHRRYRCSKGRSWLLRRYGQSATIASILIIYLMLSEELRLSTLKSSGGREQISESQGGSRETGVALLPLKERVSRRSFKRCSNSRTGLEAARRRSYVTPVNGCNRMRGIPPALRGCDCPPASTSSDRPRRAPVRTGHVSGRVGLAHRQIAVNHSVRFRILRDTRNRLVGRAELDPFARVWASHPSADMRANITPRRSRPRLPILRIVLATRIQPQRLVRTFPHDLYNGHHVERVRESAAGPFIPPNSG